MSLRLHCILALKSGASRVKLVIGELCIYKESQGLTCFW